MLNKKQLKNIPNVTGVYLFKDEKKQVIYVGKALKIRDRISSYLQKPSPLKNELLVKEIKTIDFIEVLSEVEALILEANLIKRFLPKYNVNLKDDKSFLYIIVTEEEFPRVLAARKNALGIPIKNIYGPFPSAKTVRNVLRLLRKLFPYCTAKPTSKKPCFYSQIGLCNPCPVLIKKEKNQKKYQQLKKIYLRNIDRIKCFLEGEFSSLISELERQMHVFSQKEQFEEASQVYTKIKQLEYITKPYYRIADFLTDPNFSTKVKAHSLQQLFSVLKPYFKNLQPLERIEGVDISNIMGEEAAGSLVVFINGQREPSCYKRFRIKSKVRSDVLMIQEVILRRLRRKEWPYPNLFVIDGGKPQISSATQVLRQFGNIPVIGLAKQRETIIIPQADKFSQLNLQRNSASLRLIQEIRDEAHRFARTYHHLLRRKLLNP